MESTTKEKIKEIFQKIREGLITEDEACEAIHAIQVAASSGPPVGGGNPGGGNP